MNTNQIQSHTHTHTQSARVTQQDRHPYSNVTLGGNVEEMPDFPSTLYPLSFPPKKIQNSTSKSRTYPNITNIFFTISSCINVRPFPVTGRLSNNARHVLILPPWKHNSLAVINWHPLLFEDNIHFYYN